MYAAYEAAGGCLVDPRRVRFREAFSNLKLEQELLPTLEGYHRFQTRVAINDNPKWIASDSPALPDPRILK